MSISQTVSPGQGQVKPKNWIIKVEPVFALEVANHYAPVRQFILTMATNGNYMLTPDLALAFPFLESSVQAYRDQLLFLCGVESSVVEICA